MPAPDPSRRRPVLLSKIRRFWLIPAALLAVPVGLSWYFTAPLADRPIAPPPGSARPDPGVEVAPGVGSVESAVVDWPTTRVEGPAAKQVLLDSARRSVARLQRVRFYTATFRRQERVAGVLGPEIVAQLKIRNQPFAIYLKYLSPRPGKEVVYADGHHDNKVIAHNGDWTRRLIPRLAVAPDSALALADSRHPVTDAGLLNLSRKLLRFRLMDMGDEAATTILDRATTPGGRPVLRSTQSHSDPGGGRPFCRVEILYDVESQVPFQIKSYDWPGPDHSGELDLAERYTYDDLMLDAPLTAADFDPANPDYAFMRF